MHPFLADSIEGGVLWILILFLGIACAIPAVLGISPAVLGRLRLALLLALPAFIYSLVTTGILVYFYFSTPKETSGDPDPADHDVGFFAFVWAFFSGLPLALSLFVILLAWIRNRKGKKSAE